MPTYSSRATADFNIAGVRSGNHTHCINAQYDEHRPNTDAHPVAADAQQDCAAPYDQDAVKRWVNDPNVYDDVERDIYLGMGGVSARDSGRARRSAIRMQKLLPTNWRPLHLPNTLAMPAARPQRICPASARRETLPRRPQYSA